MVNIVNFVGFESNNEEERINWGGSSITFIATWNIVDDAISGNYMLRWNPTAGNGYYRIASVSALEPYTNFSLPTTWLSLHWKCLTVPAASTPILNIRTSGSSIKCRIWVNSDGSLTIYDNSGTNSATSAAGVISADTDYLIEVMCETGSSASCYVRVDGSVVASLSGANVHTSNAAYVELGNNGGSYTCDFAYDDIVICSDMFFPGNPRIFLAVPIGAGAETGWTDGTSSLYSAIDEHPGTGKDDDTTYLQNTSGSNVYSTFDFSSRSDIEGVHGSIEGEIAAVKLFGYFAETTSTTTSVGFRSRSVGGTTQTSTTVDAGATTYRPFQNIMLTDPNGDPWTDARFDGAEFGPAKGNDTSGVKCTVMWAFVLMGLSKVGPKLLLLGVG